jgi:hypothetical protein
MRRAGSAIELLVEGLDGAGLEAPALGLSLLVVGAAVGVGLQAWAVWNMGRTPAPVGVRAGTVEAAQPSSAAVT